MAELTFTDLLELLGHVEFTAVCHRPPGGVFSSRVVPSFTAYQLIGNLAGDIWFGVNPVFGPARINSGRGLAADVVRLTAVYADLDVKPGGMSSMEAAGQVIEDLSNMLGTRPSAVVLTGHGVQPYWPIEEGPSGPSARALLRRWGRLVAHVAEIHGGRVDPVYDLARVLRVPGTVNHKAEPVPVLGIADRGKPLSVDDVDEALTAYGATERDGDRDEPGQAVVSAPAEWQWANQTCNYTIGMMDGWRNDNPTARHPWLVAQATRIASGHRYGCFDEAGYHGTVGTLVGRFRDLLARGPEARKETPGEIADALGWGQALASGKSDAEIERELGGHSHEVLSELTFERRDPFDNSSSESASQEDETDTDEEYFARAVEHAAYRLRISNAARELIAAEQAAAIEMPPFDAGTLGEILARPPEPPYRVEGLIPHESSALIVAMRKTGKTTLNLNLARSLIFGEDFLGRFGVKAISGNVGLLNYEVSAAQIARWADEIGIPHDRLYVVNLRGRRNPLSNDEDKEKLATYLKNHDCESLFVDPFGRAYTGVSQNDPGEVGTWLADLDRWARGEVGVTDLALSVHAGWVGDRSRGSSALEDWGDSIITLTRKKAGESEESEEEGHRYLRAEGRDVDVDEDRLEFDPATRLLRLTGMGSRRQATINVRVHSLIPMVVAYVNENPACSQRSLEADLPARREDIRKAAEMASQQGLITRTKIGNGWSHMPSVPATESQEISYSGDSRTGRIKSQDVDTNVLPFQTQDGVRPDAPHRARGAGPATAPPSSYRGGREGAVHRGSQIACTNPAHTPLFKAGRWTCVDCDLPT